MKLQGTIDLPGKTSDMLYFGVAGVDNQDLDHARAVVQSLESSTQMQDFLCEYQPWRSHHKRAHADVFEAKLQPVNAEKDRLSIKPSEMTEGEYMQQCASLNTQERQMEDEAVRVLTLLHFADA